MAAVVWPIEYYIIYTDRAKYDAALAAIGSNLVFLAPANAALAFTSAKIVSDRDFLQYMVVRNGDLSSYTPTLDLYNPSTVEFLPPEVGGTWAPANGIGAGTASVATTLTQTPPLASQDYTVTWIGVILFIGAKTVGVAAPHYLGKRRFVVGFELPTAGEGLVAGTGQHSARDASRTAGGMGFAYRGTVNDGYTVNTTPGGVGPFPGVSWERFYVRLRALPVGGDDNIWAAKGSVEGGKAALLNVTTNGTLTAYTKGNAAYPGTLLGTSAALTVGTWYRIDLRIQFATAITPTARFDVYVNGAQAIAASTIADGLGVVQLHTSSTIGADATATTHGLEADLDDWISAEEVIVAGQHYPGMDLTSGSHVVLVRPTGFGASQGAGWTGDWRELNGVPPHNSLSTSVVTGTTPSSVIDGVSSYKDAFLGCAAFVVGAYSVAAPATGTGAIGWVLNGATTLQAFVHASGTWSTTPTPYSVPTASVSDNLPAITSLDLLFKANSGAGTTSLQGLFAAAELLGVFGKEDADPLNLTPLTLPPFQGIHNGPYQDASLGVVPTAGILVASGIYVGNDIGQDVLARMGPNWWWVRPLTGAVDGVAWYSSMEAAHGYLGQGFQADRMTQATLVPASGAVLRPAGPSAQANANATAYQWVAVSDPAMRYMLNGAFSHKSTVASVVNALIDSGFTPEAAFLFFEQFSGSTSTHYYKGVGHATDTASKLDAAVASGVATFGAGAITSKTPLHTDTPQTAFSAWRRNDGSGAPQWFDLVSYTGNGAGGTRDIPIAINGTNPLFAIVVPHNGVSYFRDPSHTGANSQTITGTGSATAIVGGGVNLITVGVTLNANAVVYDVFVISADGASPWTNPTGPVLVAVPIPRPTNGPFPPPPTPPPPLDAGCISLATAIFELASRLGDLGGVHWTGAELQTYLTEALRAFNALTQYYKGRGTFVAVNATPFYDLPTQLPTLRGYTVKDRDLVTLLEYHLLEPPTPTAWTGTSMFSLQGLTQVLQRKLDMFLWETGMVLTRETAAVTPDANGRVPLVTDDITVRRAAWASGGSTYPLLRDDEWGQNHYARAWPTPIAAGPMTPLAYSVGATPPLTVQLAPPPTVIGTLDIIASVRGATLDPTIGVLLGIPDDYAWVIKFGALMDLLAAPGPANDPIRAQIASTLWDQGIAAAKRSSVVIDGRINTVIARIASLNEADLYQRSWQVGTAAPQKILLAGNNLVALAPVPDALGPYTVLLDVIRNIPIPVLSTDCFFEGGAALTEVLLDYAQFLALYKEGPSQAQEGLILLQRFLAACGITIAIDQASEPQRDATMGQTRQAERAVPREVEPVETTT